MCDESLLLLLYYFQGQTKYTWATCKLKLPNVAVYYITKEIHLAELHIQTLTFLTVLTLKQYLTFFSRVILLSVVIVSGNVLSEGKITCMWTLSRKVSREIILFSDTFLIFSSCRNVHTMAKAIFSDHFIKICTNEIKSGHVRPS